MSESLSGKVAVVTGAAKGIGRATARVLAREGAAVVVLDVDEMGEDVAGEIGGRFLRCDVSSAAEVAETFRKIGDVDVLINNAGVQHYGVVTDTTEEDWNRVISVNLTGAFLCAQQAIPAMLRRGGGVIINVASVQAFMSQPNVAAYTTSKTALLGLTRSIAVDYAPNIRCIAVCPGAVDTPMLRNAAKQMPASEDLQRQSADAHLTDPIATAAEVAELIAYLAGPKARYMTGQAVRIDGGLGVALPGVKSKWKP